MKLKNFLKAYCAKDMDVAVTDDWGDSSTFEYTGSVERLLNNTAVYGDELDMQVKAIDVDVDAMLMILVRGNV